MNRLTALTVLAGGVLVPVLAASPSYAAANVICVGSPAGVTCDETALTIPAAILAANGNSVDDVIRVGPGTYSDGPYTLTGGAHALNLQGSGLAQTVITLAANAASQTYVTADTAAVSDLTISMAASNSGNDRGLLLTSGQADGVAVTGGTGIQDAFGLVMSGTSQLTHASIDMPVVGNATGVASSGTSTVTDTSIVARTGISHGIGVMDASRLTLESGGGYGVNVSVQSGTVNLDDAVIDLAGSTGAGLLAESTNASAVPKTINADHVTIVGGGSGSVGALATAFVGNTTQSSSINLTNSIVRGPTFSLKVYAGNDGAPLLPSTATVTTSYSDWNNKSETSNPGGSATVVEGPGRLDVDPLYVDPANGNYRLQPGSPVVDKGNPGAGGPTTDLAGSTRVTDGDGDGSVRRDMGAYERPTKPDTTAPQTTVTKKPAKRITRAKAKISFSSEAGATFQCKVDKRKYKACTSPFKVRVKLGKHKILVRAVDKVGNVDPTPVTVKFRRVLPPPPCSGEC